MISVIVPVYNEEEIIEETLDQFLLVSKTQVEVIVVDGGSSDKTKKIVQQWNEKHGRAVFFQSKRKGRAAQMNEGAAKAMGELFVFVHADTVLCEGIYTELKKLSKNIVGGACRIAFVERGKILHCINIYSNLRAKLFGMYHGDQAMFVRRNVFEKIGGFADVVLMEDVMLSETLRHVGKTKQLTSCAMTSARRILHTGIVKSIVIYFLIKSLYRFGVSPARLAKIYGWTRK